jgi:hypothetical protein
MMETIYLTKLKKINEEARKKISKLREEINMLFLRT